MIYALDPKGIKIEAARGRRGSCPTCGEGLLAKCGEIKAWHWAHIARLDCDPWQEHETEWHRGWKSLVPPERAEVCYGEHRADILGNDECVVELQHSSISTTEIREREAFYGRMIWLLDGAPFQDKLRVETRADEIFFSWSPSRPSWLAARKPVFIHGFSIGTHLKIVNKQTGRLERHWRPLATSDDILQIRRIKTRRWLTGEARIVTVERFRERMLDFSKYERIAVEQLKVAELTGRE
ncbi:MAG: competence protein CoiA [Fimbriimonadales bacterium]